MIEEKLTEEELKEEIEFEKSRNGIDWNKVSTLKAKLKGIQEGRIGYIKIEDVEKDLIKIYSENSSNHNNLANSLCNFIEQLKSLKQKEKTI